MAPIKFYNSYTAEKSRQGIENDVKKLAGLDPNQLSYENAYVDLSSIYNRNQSASYSSPVNFIPNSISGLNDLENSNDYSSPMGIQEYNNHVAKYFLDYTHSLNQSSADKAMEFERNEAREYRNWLLDQSNTSYQRSVADMRKAGLNPAVMFSNGANGAPLPSASVANGSSASTPYPTIDNDSVRSMIETMLSLNSARDVSKINALSHIISATINALPQVSLGSNF